MVSLAIEVQDMASVHNMLVVPSPRRVPTAKEMAAFMSRLAPIEMAAPSISSRSAQNEPAPALPLPLPRKQLEVPGYSIPLAYVACGVMLCLCNILLPDAIQACAHVLGPPWTLTLVLHALATSDPAWLWFAFLAAMLLPCVLLVRHILFVCFYLLAFASFASGKFWQSLQGPPLVLACVSWVGLLSGVALSVLAEHPRAQLSVAAFFALSVAIVSSAARFHKLVLRVG
jgi:hypothetical protein